MRNNVIYDDKSIVDGLKKRDSDVIKYIYKEYYNMIRSFILSNNGKETDAEDIFQDSLVVLYDKINDENLVLTSSFKTFLYAISKNLWLQKLGKNKFIKMENFDGLVDGVEYDHDYDFKSSLFQEHFLRLGEDCQKILKLFMSKKSLKEISIILGYKTDKYVKRRKHMCKEKLKNNILNDDRYKKYTKDNEE